jgi:predicted RNase H-like HicB family nuclease
MKAFQFVVERDPETGVLVGFVPGWPGAHSQGADSDELQRNLSEVIEMLLEDGEPRLESEFVDIRTIQVARPWKASRSSSLAGRPPCLRPAASQRSVSAAHTGSSVMPTVAAPLCRSTAAATSRPRCYARSQPASISRSKSCCLLGSRAAQQAHRGRPAASGRQGEQLGPDGARQGVVHCLAALRPARALVRQDLAAGGDRAGGVTGVITAGTPATT